MSNECAAGQSCLRCRANFQTATLPGSRRLVNKPSDRITPQPKSTSTRHRMHQDGLTTISYLLKKIKFDNLSHTSPRRLLITFRIPAHPPGASATRAVSRRHAFHRLGTVARDTMDRPNTPRSSLPEYALPPYDDIDDSTSSGVNNPAAVRLLTSMEDPYAETRPYVPPKIFVPPLSPLLRSCLRSCRRESICAARDSRKTAHLPPQKRGWRSQLADGHQALIPRPLCRRAGKWRARA